MQFRLALANNPRKIMIRLNYYAYLNKKEVHQ